MLIFSRKSGTFDEVLRALCADRARYFGHPDALVYPAARIERPFSSILRLRIDTESGHSHAYVKVLKVRKPGPEELVELRQLLDNEYAAMCRLHDALQSCPGLVALRPLGVFPELLAIVTDEVHGDRFDRVIRRACWGARSPASVIESARRVGAWVRAYQSIMQPHGKVSAGREYVDLRLQALAGPVLSESDREMALRAYDALSARARHSSSPLVAIHGDLCPTNIVVRSGGDVTILDFTTAKTGSRFHDIAHLFLHLEFQSARARCRRRFLRSLQGALLDGFAEGLDPENPEFKLALLQHVACHLALLAQRPRGSGLLGYPHFLRRRWRQSMPLWAPERPEPAA